MDWVRNTKVLFFVKLDVLLYQEFSEIKITNGFIIKKIIINAYESF